MIYKFFLFLALVLAVAGLATKLLYMNSFSIIFFCTAIIPLMLFIWFWLKIGVPIDSALEEVKQKRSLAKKKELENLEIEEQLQDKKTKKLNRLRNVTFTEITVIQDKSDIIIAKCENTEVIILKNNIREKLLERGSFYARVLSVADIEVKGFPLVHIETNSPAIAEYLAKQVFRNRFSGLYCTKRLPGVRSEILIYRDKRLFPRALNFISQANTLQKMTGEYYKIEVTNNPPSPKS